MMATDWAFSADGTMGAIQPCSQAVSLMWRSTAPMVTLSQPDCSSTQEPSHRRSCGQMRPHTSGRALVASDSRQASCIRPSAARRSQSGMLFCSGQPVWQNGTPHCEQREACLPPCGLI